MRYWVEENAHEIMEGSFLLVYLQNILASNDEILGITHVKY